MPELPEVETVCRALKPHLAGRRITEVRTLTTGLRNPLDAAALRAFCAGRTVCDVRRRAKYIIVEFAPSPGKKAAGAAVSALLLHLGMTGAFRVCPAGGPLEKHARVVWTLDGGEEWRFLDARRFGSVECCELRTSGAVPAELDRLGVEPLEAGFTAEFLWRQSRGRSCPVKCLLMDQAVVVGIGNIYASETCFRAGVLPQRPAKRVTRAECARLVREARAVLRKAIACGGSTIRNFSGVNGSEGHFVTELNVYGRAGRPCPRCGAAHAVQKIVLGGRSSFYCPACQK
jgi:formamidopyrimidine-DNA glycosylase